MPDDIMIMTAKEAAAWCRVHIRTLYRWVSEGLIPHRYIGGQARFSREELQQWWSMQQGVSVEETQVARMLKPSEEGTRKPRGRPRKKPIVTQEPGP